MLDLSRRQLLQSMLAGTTLGTTALDVAGRDSATVGFGPLQPDDLRLRYRVPARQWEDALPLGNGRLGAMVWGGIARERVQLNDDTLFAGGPYTAVNPKAREALPKVRRLIFDGRYTEAEALVTDAVMSVPLRQMPYQAPGEFWIDFDGLGAISEYERTLDLDTAIASSRSSPMASSTCARTSSRRWTNAWSCALRARVRAA